MTLTLYHQAFSRTGAVLALLILLVTVNGCSEDTTTSPENLCAREGVGVAAKISGTPVPIDLCVANDSMSTTFTAAPDNRYELTATAVSDGIQITVEISFYLQANQPQELMITSDATAAAGDETKALFLYREIKTGDYDYSARSVTGVFQLSVGDQNVASGTFSNLQIELDDTVGGTPSGSRTMSGFFAVTPD